MASIETGWLTITGLEVIVLEEVVQPVRFSRTGKINAKTNQQPTGRQFRNPSLIEVNEKVGRRIINFRAS
jgi:hypothetical protein